MQKLSSLPLQHIGFVASIEKNCAPALKKKLLAMGVIAQTPIKVIRKAPLGSPIEIDLAGSRLSLRSSEADYVYVIPQECVT